MFQLTVHGETLAELGAKLLAAADALGNDAAPATSRRNASSSTGAGGSTSTTAGRTAQTSASPSDDKPGLDYEADVRPHVVKLSKVHGRDAALDVLKHFENAEGEPCANGKDIQPADWADAVKKIKAAQKRLDAEKAAAED